MPELVENLSHDVCIFNVLITSSTVHLGLLFTWACCHIAHLLRYVQEHTKELQTLTDDLPRFPLLEHWPYGDSMTVKIADSTGTMYIGANITCVQIL